MSKKVTYKNSGVDIDKANDFVRSIKKSVAEAFTKNVMQRTGAFGSLFSLDMKGIKKPVIVSSTDGVGTKLLVAKQLNKHNTVGIDLVAMNVNDILCVGAKPLFFLDYIACGKLDPKVLKDVVGGIVKGCKMSGCSLIGGETAEMPGMYKSDDYDLAGFAVGVVDQEKIIDGSKIKKGNKIIGLPSSGFHSNGYSLVRKVFSSKELKQYSSKILKPTKIYVDEVFPVIDKFKINGIAHNTGGAFYEKLTKILPNGKCFIINKKAWRIPQIFKILQNKGNIPDDEMFKTFNMGIGLILVVDSDDEKNLCNYFKDKSIRHFNLGEVVNNKKSKVIFN